MTKRKFLNKSIFIVLTLTIVFASLCFFISPTFAASSKIYYVTTSIGESYSSVGINYHCDVEESYVNYSTSKTLTNAKKVTSTSRFWEVEQNANDTNTGFSGRYVCSANLTDLNANTTYYYQIVAGSEKSNVYSFKTANITSHKSSILFLTDTQSASLATFQRVNNVIKMLKSKVDRTDLAVMTGDIVDRGGYEAQWKAYFSGIDAFNDMLLATIPGNHEYYHDNGPAYVDPSFYNQFFNNPKNGPTTKLNSSYYFKYDNVLFIMMDVIGIMKSSAENITCLNEHKTWFRKVVEENPSQWIIVGTHAGAYSAGAYASDASWIRKNFKDLFEECQVDLAISGHEHIYIRKDTFYKNAKDDTLGVTYLVGPAAGQKQYSASSTGGLDEVIAQNQCYSGNILNFDGNTLTVDYYLETGELKTSFTLNAKRTAEVQPVTNQEVEDSISFNYVEEESRVYVSWTEKLWRNATKVEITGAPNNWSSPVMSSYSNSYVLKNIYLGNNYNITLSITMNDGSVVSKTYTLNLSEEYLSYKIEYDPARGTMPSNYPTEYANSEGIKALPIPTRDGYLFLGWRDNNGNLLHQIKAMTSADLSLTAEWFKGEPTKEINYNLDGGKLPSDAPTSYDNLTGLESLPIPTKDGYKFVGWFYMGEEITSIAPLTNKNVTLNARWEKAKGCKKSSAELVISTISALSLVALVIKKKH